MNIKEVDITLVLTKKEIKEIKKFAYEYISTHPSLEKDKILNTFALILCGKYKLKGVTLI